MISFIITCVFVAVLLLTAAIIYPYFGKKVLIQERLDKIASDNEWKPETSLFIKKNRWQEFLDRFGARIPVTPRDQNQYSKMLVAAGLRKESLTAFLGSKLLLAIILPLPFIFFYALPKGQVATPQSLLYIVGLAIVGFLAPSYWLTRRVNARKMEMFHTLPDILDLLTICVEAGLGLDAALVRTTESPQFMGNPLTDEIKMATMEIRAGKPRNEALKDMADRTMVDDVKSLVAMLIQTERFGTSLSMALRVHSDSLRVKRRQIAEEAAAKTAVKMLFPLAFFVFPALLVVIMGPAFIKISGLLK